MRHKQDDGLRAHYLTVQTNNNDPPAPDEIVIALGAATSGRPHHRIGNRYSDLQELAQEAQSKCARRAAVPARARRWCCCTAAAWTTRCGMTWSRCWNRISTC
ncbi:hypothetical protein G6F40_016525 [Rhizopus arrhizus]|nr:hypothetical protein G6F40_016525 [Rhizopus arrhizus]